MLKISTGGIRLLKKLEGVKLKPYRDAGGKWTIGVGHLIKKGEQNLMDGITDAESDRLLADDLSDVTLMLTKNVTAQLNQNQVDALIILGFNIGIGRLKNSQLLKMINEGQPMDKIIQQWENHYTTASGEYVEGLAARRKKEAQLFASAKLPKGTNYDGSGNFLTLAAVIGLIYMSKN